ncbi:carbohydrate ABC transporter permease [Cohnella sp. REN36]|uniref:carbohydrate ABC transporter permease n=1 Tax=Cohnella sp. REN36 TaxID=2887347 RepID=UPI001D15AA04|nr:sugar ABC transporter permease [Cohnella sp. REN36]MCC3372319.1 sugar ABC transporter permease [Cohnella sp. REN36]
MKAFKASLWDRYAAYWFLLPALLCILVFIVYPSVRSVWMSFFNIELLNNAGQFIGFRNYTDFFQNGSLIKLIGNTLFFSIVSIAVACPFSLYISHLLNKPYWGRGFFRTLFLIPWVTPPVVAASVWKFILSENFSPINGLLLQLHLIKKPISFLGNIEWGFGPVNLPMLFMILVNVWSIFPFMMVMFLAAMQNISSDIYEAATVDGAGNKRKFFAITIPLIMPVMGITLLLQSIWQFNDFNTGFLLTRGGPLDMTNLLAVKVYSEGFLNFKYSSAATISVIMFLIVLIPSIAYIKTTGKEQFD